MYVTIRVETRTHSDTRACTSTHTPNKIRIMLTHRSNVTVCGERETHHKVIIGKHISPGKCSTVPIPGIEV